MTARGRPTRVMHRVLSCFTMFRYPCRARGPAGCGRFPIASRRRSWGSLGGPSQRCSCPPGFGSSSDPLDPLAVSRASPRWFSSGDRLCLGCRSLQSHPLQGRQPIADVSPRLLGLLVPGGQSVPNGFLSTGPAVTALGFGSSLRCSAHRGVRPRGCPSGLEVPASDRRPPEIRSRGSYPLVGLVCLTCVRSEMLLDPDKP